jgi:N-acetylneuraminate epimerase
MKFLLFLAAMPMLAAAADWSQLSSLPDKEGYAGAFAGVAGGALIVAGGTNFPDKMPWDGGTKTWYDLVHVLREPEGKWELAGRLPKPNGYGVSLTTKDGLLIIGGGDAAVHFRDVWRLRMESQMVTIDRPIMPDGGPRITQEKRVATQQLPRLPKPCAFMAGVESGGAVYVAGGIERPTDTTAMKTFWTLDLANPGKGWKELPPCPGPPRILASMAAVDGAIYLFSGAALKPGPDGKPVREWLKDAWCYTEAAGWKQLADMPHIAVAAPSPLPMSDGELLMIGGDDGALANFEPKTQHPGFPRRVIAYDAKSDRWRGAGELPFSLVTTPAVEWRGRIVIAGGESRPGKRSPEVWWR